MKKNTICQLAACLIAIALPACKSNASESSGDQSQEKAAKPQSEKLYDLEEQLRKIETKHPEIYEDPDVVAASNAMNQAYKDYNDARSAHPDVKPFFDKQKADSSAYVDAQVKGDKAAEKNLMRAFADSRAAYEKKSLEVKDLDPFRDRLKKTEQDYKNARFKYLKAIPEAKALIEKIESLSK